MVKLHFLITAGGTREYIDPVRFITNASSGKMGLAMAEAALDAGHKVTLIATTENLKLKIENLKFVEVGTAEQMFKAVKRYFCNCDCLIMAAAVSDWTPIKKSKIKIKKSKRNLIIRLKPTTDILKWAGENKRKGQMVVGFALEDRNVRQNAEKKLRDKNLDMLIANSPAVIGQDKAAVQIKQPNSSWVQIAAAEKTVIAAKIIRLIQELTKATKCSRIPK